MHLFVIPPLLTCALFSALALAAFWRAGPLERIVATALAVEVTTSVAIGHLTWMLRPAWLSTVDYFVVLIGDAALLAICLACVARAERYWSIWAASFALLGLVSDLAPLASTRITRWAWLSASLAWSYAVAGAVLWGVLTYRRGQAAAATMAS